MISNGIMPNLEGLSLRELMTVLPAGSYPNYQILGSGRVKAQVPVQGTSLKRNTKIVINLE